MSNVNSTSKKSIWFAILENYRSRGMPFSRLPNSTINQHLSINHDAELPAGYPDKLVLTIGDGGHQLSTDGGKSGFETLEAKRTNACLKNHMAFVARPIDNDLSDAERSLYCLRREEVHDGLTYAVYYGLYMEFTSQEPEIYTIEIIDGVEQTPVPFVATAAAYDGDMIQPTTDEVDIRNSKTIVVESPMTCEISKSIVSEIRNAYEVMNNTSVLPAISETGICTAFTSPKTVAVPSGTITYNEVICCQIANFISGIKILDTDEMEFSYDYSLVEPLRLEG